MSVHRRARCGRACSAADVGQSIEGQALELLAFLLGGALLGLMYDMLRPIRRAAGRGGGALDVLFCALAARCSSHSPCAPGAAGWAHGRWPRPLSDSACICRRSALSCCPAFTAVDAAAVRAWQGCKKVIKKFCKYAKSIFQKSRECFIIKHKQKVD